MPSPCQVSDDHCADSRRRRMRRAGRWRFKAVNCPFLRLQRVRSLSRRARRALTRPTSRSRSRRISRRSAATRCACSKSISRGGGGVHFADEMAGSTPGRAVSRACSRGDQQSRVSSPRHEPRRRGPAVVSPRADDFRKEPWRGSSEFGDCAEERRRTRGRTQPPPVSAGSQTPSVRAQTRNPFPGLNRFCGSNEALAHGGQRLGHTSQRLATSSRTVVTTTRLACRCVTASAH